MNLKSTFIRSHLHDVCQTQPSGSVSNGSHSLGREIDIDPVARTQFDDFYRFIGSELLRQGQVIRRRFDHMVSDRHPRKNEFPLGIGLRGESIIEGNGNIGRHLLPGIAASIPILIQIHRSFDQARGRSGSATQDASAPTRARFIGRARAYLNVAFVKPCKCQRLETSGVSASSPFSS